MNLNLIRKSTHNSLFLRQEIVYANVNYINVFVGWSESCHHSNVMYSCRDDHYCVWFLPPQQATTGHQINQTDFFLRIDIQYFLFSYCHLFFIYFKEILSVLIFAFVNWGFMMSVVQLILQCDLLIYSLFFFFQIGD